MVLKAGLNDAPVFAQANVDIAMATASMSPWKAPTLSWAGRRSPFLQRARRPYFSGNAMLVLARASQPQACNCSNTFSFLLGNCEHPPDSATNALAISIGYSKRVV